MMAKPSKIPNEKQNGPDVFRSVVFSRKDLKMRSVDRL